MQVGDCADSEAVLEQRSHGAEYVEYLDKQECANPHDYEVFAILQFPADTNESYPDGYALFNWAIESCREALEPYTGLPYGHRPGLDTARFPPTKVKWEQGDRNVYCLLYNADPDGTDPFPKLIGSKRANAD